MRYVTETYPPSIYPKLYPGLSGAGADDVARKKPNAYRYVNMAILIAGLFLLFNLMRSGFYPSGEGEETFVFLFALVQVAPLIYMEYSEFKQFKLMRKANLESKRVADLQPRHFFDFISPRVFSMAAVLLVAVFAFILHINDYDLTWGSDALISIMTIIGVHIYFAILVMWLVFGKKINPHIANKDRRIHMTVVVKIMVYTSIGMSIFIITNDVLQQYNMDYLQPFLMSIYFQILIIIGIGTMLRSTPIENMDFDVYKESV